MKRHLLIWSFLLSLAGICNGQIQKNEYTVEKVQSGSITLDGDATEPEWEWVQWSTLDSTVVGEEPPTSEDCSARFKALWDDTNFYAFIEVTDATLDTDLTDVPVGNGYWRDGIEITWDITLSDWSSGWYDAQAPINQRRIVAENDAIRNFWGMGVLMDDYEFEQTVTMMYKASATGYTYEIVWPWLDVAYGFEDPAATIASAVATGNQLGFDLFINDADGVDLGGQPTPGVDHREHQIAWDATTGDVFRLASEWGRLILAESRLTSIPANDNEKSLILYPNPATDILHFSQNLLDHEVAIFDITGKVVIQSETLRESMDISQLNAGLYVVKIQSTSSELPIVKRFLKE